MIQQGSGFVVAIMLTVGCAPPADEVSANQRPQVTQSPFFTDEDMTLTDELLAMDAEGDPIEWSLEAGATNGILDLQVDGTFTYEPAANFYGRDAFIVIAQDPFGASDPTSIEIVVGDINDAPVLQGAMFEVLEDETLTESFTAFDVDGEGVGYELTALPVSGSVVLGPEPNTFRYTPNPEYCGPDEFRVRAFDAVTTSSDVWIGITVRCVNDPIPTPPSVNVQTEEEVAVTAPLGVIDLDGDVEVVVQDPPRNGTVTLNTDAGTFTYVPDPNTNGTDDFTFFAQDAQHETLPTRVTLSVLPVNDPPTVAATSLTTSVGQPVSEQLLATDIEGDLLTFRVDTAPSHGTVTLNPDTGALTYAPDTGYTGPDAFVIEVSDGVAAILASIPVTILAN